MNNIKINKKIYKYEFLWRDSLNVKIYDSDGKLLPFPEHHDKNKWSEKESFIQKLKDVERDLYTKGKFKKYATKDYKDCLLCDKKNVTTGLFSVNNVRWENHVKHYIRRHNIKPSKDFIDYIYRYTSKDGKKSKIVARINGVKIVKSDKKFLKIDSNQILIMDALMKHGGVKIYKDKKNKEIFRYSEHAGLLDFNNSGLEKIIISGNTSRVDANDDVIFLPKNMIEALDYEYIFHTHPPTPEPGSRANIGILYEFPSISDIFHFMDHYNGGKTQGSIIIAPEGMYIVRKKVVDDKPIKINENKFYKETNKIMWKAQRESIQKYGTHIEQNTFYSKIAQDRYYINMINKVLNKYKIHIDYYSRKKDITGEWIIDTVYLPVYVIEIAV